MSVQASKIKDGLNRTGLFFEEAVYDTLMDNQRLVALKEQLAFSYKADQTQEYVSGTADYVGFHHVERIGHGHSTIFGIECKKVNEAKTWVFSAMKDDNFSTLFDRPDYIRQLELNEHGGVARRSARNVYFVNEQLTIKSFEIRDSGNVYHNNNEKIHNACKQAVQATNGFYLDDKRAGLVIFGRGRGDITINYVPLVLTNAEIMLADIDRSAINGSTGEVSSDGIIFEKKGWTYYVFNLMPNEQCGMSMQDDSSQNRVWVVPTRIVVPIVNIKYIDDFLKSYRSLVL